MTETRLNDPVPATEAAFTQTPYLTTQYLIVLKQRSNPPPRRQPSKTIRSSYHPTNIQIHHPLLCPTLPLPIVPIASSPVHFPFYTAPSTTPPPLFPLAHFPLAHFPFPQANSHPSHSIPLRQITIPFVERRRTKQREGKRQSQTNRLTDRPTICL